jgi:hypothetical protein
MMQLRGVLPRILRHRSVVHSTSVHARRLGHTSCVLPWRILQHRRRSHGVTGRGQCHMRI